MCRESDATFVRASEEGGGLSERSAFRPEWMRGLMIEELLPFNLAGILVEVPGIDDIQRRLMSFGDRYGQTIVIVAEGAPEGVVTIQQVATRGTQSIEVDNPSQMKCDRANVSEKRLGMPPS